MTDITALLQQIEQLSPESQAALAEYVAFLRWREQQGAEAGPVWSYSFIETFGRAAVYATLNPAGMDVKMAPAVVGGETRPALWAHPPVEGQAVIEYHVPVPENAGRLYLNVAVGIRDGAKIRPDNLVAFIVRVNGLRVWGRQTNAQTWQETRIPITAPAGDIIRVEFVTEALGDHQWTWAVWGKPELVGFQQHRA